MIARAQGLSLAFAAFPVSKQRAGLEVEQLELELAWHMPWSQGKGLAC